MRLLIQGWVIRFLEWLAIGPPPKGTLVMWPGADVEHYKLWVEIAGLKTAISHLQKPKGSTWRDQAE